uniref:UREA n=1 Tax=Arundo donax TaxID=35708 RepID=A0A0A9DMU0_ARUDO
MYKTEMPKTVLLHLFYCSLISSFVSCNVCIVTTAPEKLFCIKARQGIDIFRILIDQYTSISIFKIKILFMVDTLPYASLVPHPVKSG